MKILGNIIWLVLGGFAIFLEYVVSSIVLAATIIGIPFALQTFKLAVLALWPFGSKVVQSEVPSGFFTTIFNVIWIIFFGFWIALTHLFFGVLLFITIIGIPWANQHFKLAGIALAPFGRRIE
jgi:uncharacterized membrane protein YccF (DUF307 family)